MLHMDYRFPSGKVLEEKKGNQIMQEVIDCLKKHQVTIEEAVFILDNVKGEIHATTLI